MKNPKNESIYCSNLFGGALNQGMIGGLSEVVQLSEELVGNWEIIRDLGLDHENK